MTAATAAVVAMAAAPTLATTAKTWTVKPGGAFTGNAKNVTVTDSTAGQSVTCATSKATGTLKSGSGLSGTGLGSVASIAFNNCSVLGMSISVTLTGTMPLNATAYNATTKVVSETITHIHGSLNASGCSATIDGTAATANNGMVKAKFMDTGSKLKVLSTGGNLHLYNVNCFGVINSGDSVNFTGLYKVTPAQVITSP